MEVNNIAKKQKGGFWKSHEELKGFFDNMADAGRAEGRGGGFGFSGGFGQSTPRRHRPKKHHHTHSGHRPRIVIYQ